MGVIAVVRHLCQGLALALLVFPARAAECPPKGMQAGPPEIHLETAIAEPAWRNDRTRSELTELAGEAVALKGFRHSGLTQSRTEFRMTPSYRWATFPDGRACMTLTRVRAEWRVVSIVADVAREFRPGTCQHRVVREHEAQHVEIAQRTFRDWVPKVEGRLNEAARAVRASMVRDTGAEIERITQRLLAQMQPVLDAYHSDLKTRQATIDTPDSYRAESAKCTTW